MASLTEIAVSSRKVIRYGIYLVILVIIGRFVLMGASNLYQRIFPPKKPEPTVTFGKLPPLPFPPKETEKNFAYTLQTPEGTLPTFPDQIEVYFMPSKQSGVSDLEIAQTKANSLGFRTEGEVLNENVPNVYIFEHQNQPTNLIMNIITGVFSISYDLNANPTAVRGIPPAPQVAENRARGLLESAGVLTPDLTGPVTNQLLRISGGEFTPAISLSEASITKVNHFRKGYGPEGAIPAVTADMPEANVWFMFGGSGGGNQVIAAEYHHFPIEEKNNSTYPLKTAQSAWDDLNAGNAYVANEGTSGSNIVIRRVYLAYYDPNQYTEFYQPVVVFEEGVENGFVAFVPAVTSEFYGETSSENSNQ
jgi:hypothetical protein